MVLRNQGVPFLTPGCLRHGQGEHLSAPGSDPHSGTQENSLRWQIQPHSPPPYQGTFLSGWEGVWGEAGTCGSQADGGPQRSLWHVGQQLLPYFLRCTCENVLTPSLADLGQAT